MRLLCQLMSAVLIAIMVVPLLAAAVSWWAGPRLAGVVTVASGAATFGLVLALVPAVAKSGPGWSRRHCHQRWGGRLRPTPGHRAGHLAPGRFPFACIPPGHGIPLRVTAIFAVGYVFAEGDADATYRRRLFAGLNVFAWAMAMAPLVNNLGLLWVAIEVTTVVSALLVAIEGTDSAMKRPGSTSCWPLLAWAYPCSPRS